MDDYVIGSTRPESKIRNHLFGVLVGNFYCRLRAFGLGSHNGHAKNQGDKLCRKVYGCHMVQALVNNSQ